MSRPSTPSSSRCSATKAPGWSRWHGCSSTTGRRRRTSFRRPSSSWPATPTGSGTRRAAAYLRSIVINLARDHNRRGLVSFRHRPPAAPDAPSAEEHASETEERREVVEALRALPKRQRDCVALGTTSSSDPRHRGNAWRVGELGQDTPAARTAVHGPDPGGEAEGAPEDRFGEAVHDALHDQGDQPSADLFHRVVDSIDATDDADGADAVSSCSGWPPWPSPRSPSSPSARATTKEC